MRGSVAKKIRREVERLTEGVKPTTPHLKAPHLKVNLRNVWTGKLNKQGQKIYQTVYGTIKHPQESTKTIYKQAKQRYKEYITKNTTSKL